MSDSQFVQEQNMKMAAKEATQNNIPRTVKNKDTQGLNNPDPPNQLEKHLITQIGMSPKMEKMTRLGLSLLTYRTLNLIPPT